MDCGVGERLLRLTKVLEQSKTSPETRTLRREQSFNFQVFQQTARAVARWGLRSLEGAAFSRRTPNLDVVRTDLWLSETPCHLVSFTPFQRGQFPGSNHATPATSELRPHLPCHPRP